MQYEIVSNYCTQSKQCQRLLENYFMAAVLPNLAEFRRRRESGPTAPQLHITTPSIKSKFQLQIACARGGRLAEFICLQLGTPRLKLCGASLRSNSVLNFKI